MEPTANGRPSSLVQQAGAAPASKRPPRSNATSPARSRRSRSPAMARSDLPPCAAKSQRVRWHSHSFVGARRTRRIPKPSLSRVARMRPIPCAPTGAKAPTPRRAMRCSTRNAAAPSAPNGSSRSTRKTPSWSQNPKPQKRLRASTTRRPYSPVQPATMANRSQRRPQPTYESSR